MGRKRKLGAPLGVIVMGVSGSGKSTVGRHLAQLLDAPFLEGDQYHPVRNLEKMSAGIALEDDDRWPWLESLGHTVGGVVREHGLAVTACSALKRSYRERLRHSAAVPLFFVCLTADPKVLSSRMNTRSGHFMPASLLASQLATLEPPDASEDALCVDSGEPLAVLLTTIKTALAARAARSAAQASGDRSG